VTARARAAAVALVAALAAGAAACGSGGSSGNGDTVEASFYVYFTREKDANEGAEELRENGYSTEIRADQKIEWLVIAKRELPRAQVESREGEVRYIAYRHEGDYDGRDLG
jgi:hypothetical protein